MAYAADSTDHDALPARFELRELVGSGGVADVYRAHDRLLDRPVAVKVFRRDPKGRFDDEVSALARLSHAGLVSIFDVGRHGDRPYLVMQLVTGPSLKSRLLDGPLTLAETVRLGATLAAALAHAHSRGVVHRDVKPANILLDDDGVPHLADLGIALLAGGRRRTRTNEILGTPAYLAPEQVTGGEVGPAVDVYALGLVLLECLTGRIEYGDGNEIAAALARLNRRPRIPPGLPKRLATLLAAMTVTDPERRPTAAQCATGFGTATTPLIVPKPRRIGQLGLLGLLGRRVARGPRRMRPRVPVLAAAGLGLATLVAGLVYLIPVGGDSAAPNQIGTNQPVRTTVAPPPLTTVIEGPSATAGAPHLPPGRVASGNGPRNGGGSSSDAGGNSNGDNGNQPNQAAGHEKGGQHKH